VVFFLGREFINLDKFLNYIREIKNTVYVERMSSNFLWLFRYINLACNQAMLLFKLNAKYTTCKIDSKYGMLRIKRQMYTENLD
jgi:hypothetical protein